MDKDFQFHEMFNNIMLYVHILQKGPFSCYVVFNLMFNRFVFVEVEGWVHCVHMIRMVPPLFEPGKILTFPNIFPVNSF